MEIYVYICTIINGNVGTNFCYSDYPLGFMLNTDFCFYNKICFATKQNAKFYNNSDKLVMRKNNKLCDGRLIPLNNNGRVEVML